MLLAGDLYHYPEERNTANTPTFEFNHDQSLASRAAVEAFVKKTGAQLWIMHDMPTFNKQKKHHSFTNRQAFAGHPLLPIDREREQDVTVRLAVGSVAGVGEHHAVHDNGSSPVDRSTFAGNLIHRVERPHGIEIPNNLAGLGRIRAEMAVDCP